MNFVQNRIPIRKIGSGGSGEARGGSSQNRGRGRRGATGSSVASLERQSDAESDSAKIVKGSGQGGHHTPKTPFLSEQGLPLN